jgi:hypothetical protein
MQTKTFIEVGFRQVGKHGQPVCGDSFLSRRIDGENRIIAVLADGLGSGVKASVLSLLTSTMALQCMAGNMESGRTARIIMETLPICNIRKIGYSTFTILDIEQDGHTSIIEHDNPACLWFRGTEQLSLGEFSEWETVPTTEGRPMRLCSTTLVLQPQDRLVLFSDGVTQAGMGIPGGQLGMTERGVVQLCTSLLKGTPDVSAQELASQIVDHATALDGNEAKDDITVAVVYFRPPRETLVLTGPPFHRDRDREFADYCTREGCRKIICGGTTADIVSRELGRELNLNVAGDYSRLPPASLMEGVDLVTEGIITLSHVLACLEGEEPVTGQSNPAAQIVAMLLDSDIITFLVGARLNEAHHDPSLPVELDIRKNTVRRICRILEQKYLKAASFRLM